MYLQYSQWNTTFYVVNLATYSAPQAISDCKFVRSSCVKMHQAMMCKGVGGGGGGVFAYIVLLSIGKNCRSNRMGLLCALFGSFFLFFFA